MKLYNTSEQIILEHNGQCYLPKIQDWDLLFNHENVYHKLASELSEYELLGTSSYLENKHLLAPIGSQEVWASGVTYMRSKDARMEESKESGGATFYDKVYDAERPELFFKSTPARVVGTGAAVRIRKDSSWNVPEPELTLAVNNEGKIIGYTIGNDMSSRSIEGENPLYLPQAKVYDGATAMGPCLLLTEQAISPDTQISIEIKRDGKSMFADSIAINRMKRKHDELVAYLFMEMSFAAGAYLMTGTGIVPGNDFTLASGDELTIQIEHIGKLVNVVA